MVNSDQKFYLMAFVNRVLWILKALWIVLSETLNILRNLQQEQQIRGEGVLRILPSVYVHNSLQWSFIVDPQSSFQSDSKEVWGSFLMSGVRMLHFSNDWWIFIQIHQYYTMAFNKEWGPDAKCLFRYLPEKSPFLTTKYFLCCHDQITNSLSSSSLLSWCSSFLLSVVTILTPSISSLHCSPLPPPPSSRTFQTLCKLSFSILLFLLFLFILFTLPTPHVLSSPEMPLFKKFPEIRKFHERKNFRKNKTVSLDKKIIDQKGLETRILYQNSLI